MATRRLPALVLCASLASGTGCAHDHYQITNRQFAIGAIIGAAVIGLVVLGVVECTKTNADCQNVNQPPQH